MPFELLIWKAYLMGRVEGLALAEKLLEEQARAPVAPLRSVSREKRNPGCEKPVRRVERAALAQPGSADAKRELLRKLRTAGIRSIDWAEVARQAALAIPCAGVSISLEIRPVATAQPERFEGKFGTGGIPVASRAASCLRVPLPAGGLAGGAISLFNAGKHRWTESESEFAQEIAAGIKRMTGGQLLSES